MTIQHGEATERRRTDRREFMSGMVAGAGWLATGAPMSTIAAAAQPAGRDPKPAVAEWFPRQDPALVEQVVRVAHGDLEAVRRLVEKRPELAKAAWDWGYGDWETPLGAASHTGRREIALFLLQNGARPSIFSAAMLGQLDVVRAFVAAAPGVQEIPGPHGIPLLMHAKVGGPAAAGVVAFLESLTVSSAKTGASAPDPRLYVGSYSFGPGATDRFEVTEGPNGMAIARAGGMPRGLVPIGDHVFHPAGAPSIRVQFQVAGERALALVVLDPDQPIHAARIASA